MTAPIEITTQRLILSPVTPSLINHLFEHTTKDKIMSYFGVDEAGYDHLQLMHEKGIETFRFSLFYFLLLDKDTRRVLGECGFHTWNKSHRKAELFYNLRHDSDKRKGYMKEALAEVLDYGFNKLELHRIAALTADSNIASKRLLELFGFTKEGAMREDYVVDGKNEDSECFSLLKPEWESSHRNDHLI